MKIELISVQSIMRSFLLSWVCAVLLFVVNITRTEAGDEETFLITVSRADPGIDVILHEGHMPVFLKLEDVYIAEAEREDIAHLEARRILYRIIDRDPGSHEYLFLHSPSALPEEVLTAFDLFCPLGEDRFVVRAGTADLDRLSRWRVSIIRITQRPLPLGDGRRGSESYLGRIPAADSLIEFLLSQVSVSNLYAYIGALQNFGTRYSFTPQCSLAAEYLYRFFHTLGLDVDFDPFEYHGHTWRNVVATLPGTVYPDSIYIICGHYDSTNRQYPEQEAPGADDNASGTAAVLEAARILSQCSSTTTIRFICFSGEEQGLLGSQHYAGQARSEGMNIGGVLNFDMIAYQEHSHERDIHIYADEYSVPIAALFDSLAVSYTELVPELRTGHMGASDHFPFQQNHYQAILVIERATNPHYHSSHDLLETLTIPFAAEVVQAGLATLSLLAGVSADPSGPKVSQIDVLLDDDDFGPSDGNGNGAPEPLETIALNLVVRNHGETTAYTTVGILRTDDPYVSIVDTFCYFYDVTPGGTATSSDPVVFRVSEECPNGRYLTFNTVVRDRDDQVWTSHFSFRVLQPVLLYESFRIDDDGGDGDGIPEWGEPVDLYVTLSNTGFRSTAGLQAEIISAPAGVILLDDDAAFADVAVGAEGSNHGNPFTVVLPKDGGGNPVEFRVRFTEDRGYFTQDVWLPLRANQGPVLLVVDDGGIDNSDFYAQALKHIGVMYDQCIVGMPSGTGLDSLSSYGEVIWFAGPVGVETLTLQDQAALAGFLDGGGHLCLSGGLIGYDIGESDFYREYVHAAYIHSSTGLHHLNGPTANPVTGDMYVTLAAEGMNRQFAAGEIDPVPPAFTILNYDRETDEGAGDIRSSGCGALAYENDVYKVAYCAFGIEGVEPLEDRMALLTNLLSWFNAPLESKGDVNGDGRIDALDLVLAIHISLERYEPTDAAFRRADYNYDGEINVIDIASMIFNILNPK